MIATITLIHGVDDEGRGIVKVPLSDSGSHATLYEEDFEELLELGLSPRWKCSLSTQWHVVARVANSKSNFGVAQEILADAGKGQVVHFLNGDKRDLRRDNLVIGKGGGLIRARDFVAPPHKFTPHLPNIQHIYEHGKTSIRAGSVMN